MQYQHKISVFWPTLLLLALLLSSCGDDSNSIEGSALQTLDDGECSIATQNEFVYREMQDTYLWYDTVPNIDPKQYSSPLAVLNATRNQSLDRFSYIISVEDFNALLVTGEYIGFGFSVDRNGYIRFVYSDAPASSNGMQRGDRILFVNDISTDTIIANGLWDSVFGESTIGVQASITLEKVDTDEVQVLNLSKAEINRNAILHRSIIDQGVDRIGYFVFDSFSQYANAELADAFEYFDNQNVNKLILDLRYNPGGSVSVAQYLASLITGPTLEGQTFLRIIHNDKHQNSDSSIPFTDATNALGINKLVVLTTASSCSASEAIANGLEPYIDVEVVGDTSCGKPIGMHNPSQCGFILSHIEFKVANVNGYGDYFDGITPDCIIADDSQHDFGDTNEALLSEALYLIENNTCSPKSLIKSKTTRAEIEALQPWNPLKRSDLQ